MIDYTTLRLIWWLLLGILLIGFAVMDGFDFGVGILLPFVARKDIERRIVINTVGPVWEGNQVWLILGGGAIFAAWPTLYAVSFSSFYFAMLLLLLTLIFRPVAFKYRSKIQSPAWRSFWDWILFVSGFVPTLVFGVAIGNTILGIPFHFDFELRPFYTGSFWQLFTPFTLLCGLVSVAMITMHGGLYLACKTDDPIRTRAIRFARLGAVLTIILFAIGGLLIAYYIPGYTLTQAIAHDGPSNPIAQGIIKQTGAWLVNYQQQPLLMIAPILGFLGAIIALLFARFTKFAFLNSSFSIMGIILTVGFSLFPFLLPSSSNPNMSLLVWNASSSHLTLFIMLIATLIFLPIILLYTTWVYRVMRGKVREADILQNEQAY